MMHFSIGSRAITMAAVFALLFGTALGQTPYVLEFDGVDDHVDLGAQVGNGVRTIELWFSPTDTITSDLTEAQTLVAREATVQNIEEFSICFSPVVWGNAGRLRFTYAFSVSQNYNIYSDTTLWVPGRWYHVAAVIHPTQGMLLFVNGHLQSQTEPAITMATASSTYITALGCWGDLYDRYYKGQMDEVRFSSTARYMADFEPPCPDLLSDSVTLGLYHLNEGANSTALDVGSYMYDGTIDGAVYQNEFICKDPSSVLEHQLIDLTVYPNPATTTIRIQLPEGTQNASTTIIYDMQGRLVHQQPFTTTTDVSTLSRGTYAIVVQAEEGNYRGMIQKE